MTDYMGTPRSADQNAYEQPYVDVQSVVTDERAQRVSVARTYAEMALGLAVVQIGVVIFLSARALRMNPAIARIAFYAYAALMGFTLSYIFFVYNIGNIVFALGLTAAFFFTLTMFALTTKMNLLKLGPILMVALIVLIVAEIIMMFMDVGVNTMFLSAITLLIFAGFTAYDAQVARALFAQYAGDEVMIKRVSILCALNLYLDFINFFISMLNLLTSRD